MRDEAKGDVIFLVRDLCRLLGIRQRHLADSLRLTPGQINLYFQGKAEMRADRLVNLLKILDIDVEEQLRARIRELGVETLGTPDSRVLASIGALNESKKRSIFKIIKLLGAK